MTRRGKELRIPSGADSSTASPATSATDVASPRAAAGGGAEVSRADVSARDARTAIKSAFWDLTPKNANGVIGAIKKHACSQL